MKYLFRIFSYVRNLWPYYLTVIVLGVISSLLSLAVPFIMKAVTDVIVQSIGGSAAQVGPVIWWAVLLFGVDIAATLLQNWAGYLGDIMSARLRQTMSERYYEHLLQLPQSYYDNELTGTIINRLNRTITEVTQFINMFANNFFSMYLTLLISLVVLLAYSWQLALMMTLLYPVFMWVTAKTSDKWQVWQKEKNLETDIASGRFAEVVGQIKVVKSFIQEQLEFGYFRRRNQTVVDVTRTQSAYWHKMDIYRRAILNVIFFGAMLYIFVNTVNRQFSVGDMVLLTTLLGQMRFPIFNMSFIIDNTQKAIAGCRDYFEVMEITPAVADMPDAKELRVTKGEVCYQNVDFKYTDDAEVLHNVNFTIKPGEKVALVGESGEGKTTITSLLLRLYNVTHGSISIDGQPIDSVSQSSLRRQIAVVFQEPALFSGTLRENIAYGNPGATAKEIEFAAKAANAYDFIAKLEHGLDTEIGERGLKLSGGQKQRVAIARALLKDAPLLILDEATSSLDSRSERLVQEALERLMKRRTTIIIAHRLSTIANVDRIVTLKNGRIDEIGTPRQLSKTNGIYAQLLQLQGGKTAAAKTKLKQFDIAA
ncbi:MAG: ABC transporter ATP-binding protein [Candidatus Saccharimonas sp.]